MHDITERSPTGADADPEPPESVQQSQCPECGGRIHHDDRHGERRCLECGLVITAAELDRGPTWVANTEDGKRHVGSPLTSRFADEGMGTKMGHGDHETATAGTSHRRRRQLRRLHRRQQWANTTAESSVHRNALSEVRRIATALGLTGDVRDAATSLLSDVYEAGFFPGHSVEGVAAAVVYATARMFDHPRRLTAVLRVAQVDEQKLRRTYLSMVQACSLPVPHARPQAYLPALATDLDLRRETERYARALLEELADQAELTGQNPVGLAAMAIYAASCVTTEPLTQSDIAGEADISAVTIRTAASRVEDITGSPPETLIRSQITTGD